MIQRGLNMAEKPKIIIKIGAGSPSVIKVISSTYPVEIRKITPKGE